MSSGNSNNNKAVRGNRATSRPSSSPPPDRHSPGHASDLAAPGTGRRRFHPYSQGDRAMSRSSGAEEQKQEVQGAAEHGQYPPQELVITSPRLREAELEASVAQYRTEAEEARQAYLFSLRRERELRQEIERLEGNARGPVQERELRQKNEKLEDKAHELIREKARLKKQIRDANSDITDLILQTELAQGGERLAKREIEEKEEDINELEERLDGATAENEQLREQLANAPNRLFNELRQAFQESLAAELQKNENLRHSHGQQLREQTERAQAAIAENRNLRARLQERAQTISGLNVRLEARLSPNPRTQPPAPTTAVGPSPAVPTSAPVPNFAPTPQAPAAAAAAAARRRRQPARACKGKVRSYKEPRS